MTKSINIEDFEAHCLTLLDEVATTGEPVVITRDGVPVAELLPLRQEHAPRKQKPKSIFGAMKDEIEIKGDIISPIDVEWEAMK